MPSVATNAHLNLFLAYTSHHHRGDAERPKEIEHCMAYTLVHQAEPVLSSKHYETISLPKPAAKRVAVGVRLLLLLRWWLLLSWRLTRR